MNRIDMVLRRMLRTTDRHLIRHWRKNVVFQVMETNSDRFQSEIQVCR